MTVKKRVFLVSLVLMLISSRFFAQAETTIFTGFTTKQNLLKNQNDIYLVSLTKGDFIEIILQQNGVDVVIDVFNPDGKKLKTIDTPNGKKGKELILFEAESTGTYQMHVHPFNDPDGMSEQVYLKMLENNQGSYSINQTKVLSASEMEQKLSKEKNELEKKIGWIRSNSIELNNLKAESGFKDLAPLRKVLNDVKYVGLGEATHGSKEFFQIKHRLLEFLVKELGFTIFAIEASSHGCEKINDYIQHGKGDVYTALASQNFWVWDTEEVISMIEWMRNYNLTESEQNKIKFVGFDILMEKNGLSTSKIEDYLQKVDTIFLKEIRPILDIYNAPLATYNKDSLQNSYTELLSTFIFRKGILIKKSSEKEYEEVLDGIRILGQYLDTYVMRKSDSRYGTRNWRDYYMAENFFNLLSRESPEVKVVLWAHNGHITHNSSFSGKKMNRPLGYYLKKAFGNRYYSFGFGFDHGSFNAIEYSTNKTSIGLQKFTVKPSKKHSIDWYFAQTGIQSAILDLRTKDIPDFIESILNILIFFDITYS